MKLTEIAKLITGEVIGADIEITGIASLESQKPGSIGYVEKKNLIASFAQTDVAAIIIPADAECQTKPAIRVANPKLAFSKLLEIFSPYKPYEQKVYSNVYIADSAKIGKDVTILPFTSVMDNAVIGDDTVIYSQVFVGKDVRIGKNCVIKAGVKIDDLSVIGDNVIIHHNSVIGGDGFGYVTVNGKNMKVPQIGRIVIENDVEIGAGVTVDRATQGETRIGEGVKIDNLVQVAHNVKLGANTIICAQVGVAGSSTIGKNCILAGQVGVTDHCVMGDEVIVMAQAGIDRKKIESKQMLFGTPAREFMLQKRIHSCEDQLPELVKTIREIKKRFDNEEK